MKTLITKEHVGKEAIWKFKDGTHTRIIPALIRDVKDHKIPQPGGQVMVLPCAEVAVPVGLGKKKRFYAPLIELTLANEFVLPQFAGPQVN